MKDTDFRLTLTYVSWDSNQSRIVIISSCVVISLTPLILLELINENHELRQRSIKKTVWSGFADTIKVSTHVFVQSEFGFKMRRLVISEFRIIPELRTIKLNAQLKNGSWLILKSGRTADMDEVAASWCLSRQIGRGWVVYLLFK